MTGHIFSHQLFYYISSADFPCFCAIHTIIRRPDRAYTKATLLLPTFS